MKKLKLQNKSYKVLLISFKEWLDILGFSQASVYGYPIMLQEFFYYLERRNITGVDYITAQLVKEYYQYLQQRPNERQSGGLSKSYLNGHQQALKKFREYLKNHNHKGINIHLKSEAQPTEERINILSQSEIKELFAACNYSSKRQCIRIRDKALLTIFYSCGLRRNEAVHLDIKDVLFDKQRIYVRKGKNYKERFVPINKYNLSILEDYIYEYRPQFLKSRATEYLLISMKTGCKLSANTTAKRLERIVNATGDQTIIQKKITPHKLRHAIATHFLEAGMNIEDIKQFLVHSHLETTQIYTHLIKKL